MHFFDASGTGEMASRLLVIAGDQADAGAQRVQAAHGIRSVGPQRVAKRQQAEQHAVARHADDRQSARFEFVDACVLSRQVHGFGCEKHRTAHHQPSLPEASPDAMTGDGFELLHLGQCEPALKRFFHHRSGERMFGKCLYACHEREQFLFRTSDGVDRPQGGAALGQRAGLVKHHAVHAPQGLKRLTGTHQYAALGRFARAAYDGQRCRDAHGAGIAHDQHAQAGKHRPLQIGGRSDEKWAEEPEERRTSCGEQHDRRVHAQYAVHEMQQARFEGAGVFDAAHHLPEKTRFPDHTDAHQQRAMAVQRATHHPVSGALLDG